MSVFDTAITSKNIKAYEVLNNPPILGDIRTTKDYPAGTPWSKITEFEVWGGSSWISPDTTFTVQSYD